MSVWRKTPPDAEGWWWIWTPDDLWRFPTPHYFRPAMTTVEKAVGAFVSDGPGRPMYGWTSKDRCAPMPGPPPFGEN